MSNVVQRSIYSLLTTEPFFAHFILNSNIVYDKYKVPTAGVTVIHGVPTFVFNSEFMAKMTQQECVAVLKHEVMHLVMDHLSGIEKLTPQDKYLSNIATDCAINQYLQNLPKDCVTLERVEEAVGKKLQPFQTSDYYFEHMKKKQKEMEASGMQTLDEHDIASGEEKGNEAINKASVRPLPVKPSTKPPVTPLKALQKLLA